MGRDVEYLAQAIMFSHDRLVYAVLRRVYVFAADVDRTQFAGCTHLTNGVVCINTVVPRGRSGLPFGRF